MRGEVGKVLGKMLVGFDTETHLFKPGMVTPRIVCASFHNEDFTNLRTRSDKLVSYLNFWLSRDEVELVGHNVAFDLAVIAAEWPEFLRAIVDKLNRGKIRCTRVRQMLIDIAAGESDFRYDASGKASKAGRSLADLGKLYFGEFWDKSEDTWRLRYYQLDGVPLNDWPNDASGYAKDDAARTFRVFHAQTERMKQLAKYLNELSEKTAPEDGSIPDEARQTIHAFWLYMMGAWGLRTDADAVHKMREHFEQSKKEVFEKLHPVGLVREDGTRDMTMIRQCVIAAYYARGLDAPRTAPSDSHPEGQVKADTETLIESGEEHLIMLGKSLSEAATVNTWLPHLEAGIEKPICVSYNSLVDSGRTSARNPNIQNPPRDGKIRACFIPRDGYVFSFADYDTAELRALAQVCLWLVGRSDLADALRNGEDPHLSLAAQMKGISFEEALERFAQDDPEIKEARQFAKVPNFGLPGGLGVDSLISYARGSGYDIDRDLASRTINQWFSRWSEMRAFFDVVKRTIGPAGEGPIVQFWSERIRGACGFNQAANTTFQGLVADGAKRAGWALFQECYLGKFIYEPQNDYERTLKRSPLYHSRPVIFMHDEFGLEIPEVSREHASRAAERQAYVQRKAMAECIPDVPILCSAVLQRRWYKGAKSLKRDGFLVPSKPVKNAQGKTEWVEDVR